MLEWHSYLHADKCLSYKQAGVSKVTFTGRWHEWSVLYNVEIRKQAENVSTCMSVALGEDCYGSNPPCKARFSSGWSPSEGFVWFYASEQTRLLIHIFVWGKREGIPLLLKPILKYSFDSSVHDGQTNPKHKKKFKKADKWFTKFQAYESSHKPVRKLIVPTYCSI